MVVFEFFFSSFGGVYIFSLILLMIVGGFGQEFCLFVWHEMGIFLSLAFVFH